MGIAKVPDKLPCLKFPISVDGGPYLVPLPQRRTMNFRVRSKESFDIYLSGGNNHVIIEHPDSNIATLSYVSAFSKRNNTTGLEIRMLRRVRVKRNTRERLNGLEYARFRYVSDIPPTEALFFSEDFQLKFSLLKEILVEIFFETGYLKPADGVDTDNFDIERFYDKKQGVTPDTIGGFIDDMMLRTVAPHISEDELAEEVLVEILKEQDVEFRLDLAIEAADWCLAKAESDRDNNSDKVKRIPVKSGSSEDSKSKNEKPIERRGLVRGLLLGAEFGVVLEKPDFLREIPESVPGEYDLPDPDELDSPIITSISDYLESRVIGQKRPIKNIVNYLALASAGIAPENRPLGVFFFSGPTGVGKTETAKALADFLHEQEKGLGIEYENPPLVKVDSTQYGGTMQFAVSQLVGSPAGYVGSKGTKGAVKPIFHPDHFPGDRVTVLLFDEIEKALKNYHSAGSQGDLESLLVTVLDEGSIVNNWNDRVDLSRTIIIFTSNIGAQKIAREVDDGGSVGFHSTGKRRKDSGINLSDDDIERLNERIFRVVDEEYRNLLSPELRNRVDRHVVYRFLTRDDVRIILNKELNLLLERISSLYGVDLRVDQTAFDWLIAHGVQLEMGVRSMQRTIKRKIGEGLSKFIVSGVFSEGDIVKVKSPDPEDKDVDPKFFKVIE